MAGYASVWCRLWHHKEALLVCRELGLVWECPDCLRRKRSALAD